MRLTRKFLTDMLYSKVEESDEYVSVLTESIKKSLNLEYITRKTGIKGGIINKAALYCSNLGELFVKYAPRQNTFSMFETEQWSLEHIGYTGAVRVPKSIQVGHHPAGGAYHVLEYLEGMQPVQLYWKELGRAVAKMHLYNHEQISKARLKQQSVHHQHQGTTTSDAVNQDHQEQQEPEDSPSPAGTLGPDEARVPPSAPQYQFGASKTCYLGPEFTIPADVWCDTYPEFYSRYMMKPIFDLLETKFADQELRELWSKLEPKIEKMLSADGAPPSLLHGDLCIINVGETPTGPVIFDPSSNYGHWESDFTIVTLEDNFPEEFFTSYFSVIPKPEGFAQRQELYHLFCHLLCYSIPGEDHQHRGWALEKGEKIVQRLYT